MTVESRVPLRVLAVDDHPVFLRGLVATFHDVADVLLCGTASTSAEALQAVHELHPDVVLLDLGLPDVDGIETARRLLAGGFAGALLILTMFEDETALVAAIEAGARGYLLKGADQQQILAAVRSVAGGGLVIGEQLASAAASSLVGGHARPPAPLPGISARESEVLALMVAGRSNDQIARELVVSGKTVRNHITSIFAKLGVTDRREAIERGRAAGLGAAPAPWTPAAHGDQPVWVSTP
jgi:DNA-binding NarL/FixJ family response regulator